MLKQLSSCGKLKTKKFYIHAEKKLRAILAVIFGTITVDIQNIGPPLGNYLGRI